MEKVWEFPWESSSFQVVVSIGNCYIQWKFQILLANLQLSIRNFTNFQFLHHVPHGTFICIFLGIFRDFLKILPSLYSKISEIKTIKFGPKNIEFELDKFSLFLFHHVSLIK